MSPSRAAADAHLARGELTEAMALLRRALVTATPEEAVDLRLRTAWIEHQLGRLDASDRTLDLVGTWPNEHLAAKARCIRGNNLCSRGELVAAEIELSAAARILRRHADGHWLANAVVGRGVVRTWRLRLAAADADFVVAQRLCADRGERQRVASCVHNRGYVASRAGDLPKALRLYDEAERIGLRRLEQLDALVDRAEALLAGGLIADAATVLARGARLLDDAGKGLRSADAHLAYGRCAARAGEYDVALRAVRRARRMFARQGRAAWSDAATALALQIGLARGTGGLVGRASRAADRELVHGRRIEAAELRLAAARVAHPATARTLLEAVAAERSAGPATLRAAGWLARARLAGTPGAVLAACRAGLSVVDEHAAAMGALELRAGAVERAAELAATGLSTALGSGNPATVLRWTERYRAAVLRVDPVVPPRDPALADGLARLRAADQSRRAGLERKVRSMSLSAKGTDAERWRPPRVDELAGCLGDAALVSYVAHERQLAAVSVVDGRTRLHRLGSTSIVDTEVDALRFAVGLHARTGGRRAAVAAARAADRLDAALLAPVGELVGDRRLVVVPTGGLHGLPWAALSRCAGRPVSVAPSASAWMRAARRRASVGSPVLVAGPGLPAADREVAALHESHGGVLLDSSRSTVDSVLAAMDGAGLVHVAAHGRFREDSPMFSCIDLADGPLYGYDLDGLGHAPHWLVLSACEAARAVVHPCDELLGLATVLLRRGTSALIASTIPVPDELTAELMAPLHRHLAAGLRPAAALARAQADLGADLGFVCLGAG